MPTLRDRLGKISVERPLAAAKKLAVFASKRRLVKAVPIVGPAVAVFAGVSNVRRKGLVLGGVDTALDLIPWVGRAKALYEFFQGDIIPGPETD